MSMVLINDFKLQGTADAIKAKRGSNEKMFPSEMPAAINAISASGESENVNELLASIADGSYQWGEFQGEETNINSLIYNRQTPMSSYTNNNLKEINIDGAFSYNKLTSFKAPNLDTLNNKSATFQYCDNLTEVDLGNVTKLPVATFYASKKIGYVPNADKITEIGQQCFSFNPLISDLYLPQVQSIGPFAFAQCGNLQTILLPSIISLTANIFNNSHGIQVVDLGDTCISVTNSAFSGCKIDLTLIVRAVKPPTLNGSFMLGSGGAVISILVPTEAVDAYKSATNWSNYAPVISAISN